MKVYDTLYEAWVKEKKSDEVQKLPEDFYVKAANYIKRLMNEHRMLDKKSVKAKVLRRKTGNVKAMVRELLFLRIEKMTRKALNGEKVSENVLTLEERKWNRNLVSIMEDFQLFLDGVLRGKSLDVAEEKPKRVVVRFLKDVPAIVGADMKTYGPFLAEDVAVLPFENAKILVKQGVAVMVEVDG